MKIKTLALYIFLTLFAVSAYATDFMALAEGCYTRGNYDSCVVAYDSVLAQGLESSTLYYNLGNAYFRLGQNTKAIINYERALKLDPSNADARHNLAFANKNTIDKLNTAEDLFLSRWWAGFRNIANADTWSYWSIGLFSLFILALLGYIFLRVLWMRKSAFSVAVISFAASLLTFILAYQQNSVQTSSNSAIIVAQTVTVSSTPDDGGKDLFTLHEGTKVTIGDVVGNYYQITTDDDRAGWVTSETLEKI